MPTPILMPALSPTMEEGTLAKWLVKEGDAVKAGDVIAEIETDKATMEVEAADEGRLGRILVPEGTENVKVNVPIAVLLEEGEDASALAPTLSPAPTPAPVAKPPATPPPSFSNGNGLAPAEPAPLPPAPGPASGSPAASAAARLFASPLARRLAAQKGLDLAAVIGTGPRGRIVKADVDAAALSPPAPKGHAHGAGRPSPHAARPPVPEGRVPGEGGASAIPDARLYFKDGTFDEIPHDSIRRTIARRLTAAKRDIPHYYLTVDCRLDAVIAARTALNAHAPAEGPGAFKLSVNDFVVKAAAVALMRVPGVNASWTESAILRHAHADIGVAVALPFGLITPIVFAAETKGLAQISREVRDLAARAKAKKLKPAEFEGGSFAISNLGMYGIRDFTAVINPPHAAILAVGMGEERVVVEGGQMRVATLMTVRLSCDHRVIDGALGAAWLAAFKACIESPVEMLV